MNFLRNLFILVGLIVIGDGKAPTFELWTDETLPKLAKDIIGVNDVIRESEATTEVYKVTTEDGYILPLTRLVNLDGSDMNSKEGHGTPVLVVHGHHAAHDVWITRGRGYDLVFILMDLGYDVWLYDQRGNYFSKNHVEYSANDARFWNYTFHEMAFYDIPAFIDTIIEVTNRPKIFYIGHSLGTTLFFAAVSMKPEYNDKIILSICLAPVGSPLEENEYTPFLKNALNAGLSLSKRLIDSGIYELTPRTKHLVHGLNDFCGSLPTQRTCLNIIGLSVGEHRENIKKEFMKLFISRFPAGSSMKTNYHLVQVVLKGFRMLNEGSVANLKKYGTPLPPHYPVDKITVPTIFYHGLNDRLVSFKGMKELARSIPGLVDVRIIPDPQFNHIDFVYGTNAKEVLYNDVIKDLKNYSSQYESNILHA